MSADGLVRVGQRATVPFGTVVPATQLPTRPTSLRSGKNRTNGSKGTVFRYPRTKGSREAVESQGQPSKLCLFCGLHRQLIVAPRGPLTLKRWLIHPQPGACAE